MTLGEKIRDLRKKCNMTQEVMADRLNVSRQAITKWETDAGCPDIANIKAIATLFNVSIDELLDYRKDVVGTFILNEDFTVDGIKKTGKARCKEEEYLKSRFKNASQITYINRKKKWSIFKHIFWFLIEPSYNANLEELLANGNTACYLIIENEKQYMALIHKKHLDAFELKVDFSGKKLLMDGYIYKKIYNIL